MDNNLESAIRLKVSRESHAPRPMSKTKAAIGLEYCCGPKLHK